ncbi:hypothetical protein F5148DRAFT_1248569 [Russula earlei]|uniref:Uncharacterized protein n=1 Tax=Russula earlei TaxID=71964 RepID=A0ACC0TUM5_9AGAM|nr:hypothetical protein F5148DRAFT_1248569 [Russula earlei]
MPSSIKRRHTPSPSQSSSPSRTPKALRMSTPVRLPLVCSLPPTCHPPNHSTPLSDSHALEAHYATHHAHVCSSKGCGCVFPDARLLELHLTECHDPLSEIRRERGEKIFACHLSSCTRMFASPKARRLHLINSHAYPKEYFFAVTNKGIGGLLRRWGDGASLLRGSWHPRETEGNTEGDSPSPSRLSSSCRHSDMVGEGGATIAVGGESSMTLFTFDPAVSKQDMTPESMSEGAANWDDNSDKEVNALTHDVSALGLVPSPVHNDQVPRGRLDLPTRPAARHIDNIPPPNHHAAANNKDEDHDVDRELELESNSMEQDAIVISEKSRPVRGRRGRGRASGDGRGGGGGSRGMGRSRGFIPPPPRGGFLLRGAGRGFPRGLIGASMRARGRGM